MMTLLLHTLWVLAAVAGGTALGWLFKETVFGDVERYPSSGAPWDEHTVERRADRWTT